MLNQKDMLQTIDMIDKQHLDVRTITMGISLRDCAHPDPKESCRLIYEKMTRLAEKLVPAGEAIEKEFGIPIVNKRISVTPIALVAESSRCEFRGWLFRSGSEGLYPGGPAADPVHS